MMATATYAATPAAAKRAILNIEDWPWSRRFICLGAFFVVYQDFRPLSVLFTYSDIFFLIGGVLVVLGRGVVINPLGSLSKYWFLCFSMLLTFMMVSSVVNGSPVRFLVIGSQYAFSYIFLPAILFSESSSRWRTLAFSLVAGVFAMEVFAIAIINHFDFVHARVAEHFGRFFYTGNGRLGAFVANPNQHSAIICMSLPFLYYFRARDWIPLWLFVVVFVTLMTAIMYAASATGAATSIIVTVLFAAIARLKVSPKMLAVVALGIGLWAAAGSPLPGAFEKRVAPAFSTGNIEDAGTFSARYELMKEAWDYADDTTFLGLGTDQFGRIGIQELPVHNTYLLMWTEAGFPAFLGWVGLLTILVSCPLRIIAKHPREAALGLSVMAAMIVFSMSSVFMYARIWIAFALLGIMPAVAIQAQLAAHKTRRPGYKRLPPKAPAPAPPSEPWSLDWADRYDLVKHSWVRDYMLAPSSAGARAAIAPPEGRSRLSVSSVVGESPAPLGDNAAPDAAAAAPYTSAVEVRHGNVMLRVGAFAGRSASEKPPQHNAKRSSSF